MRTFVIIAALAVAACTPPAEQSADQPAGQSTDAAGPNNCDATVPSTWVAGSETITVEASSAGAFCASAEATITLRRAEGGAMEKRLEETIASLGSRVRIASPPPTRKMFEKSRSSISELW